MVNSKKVTINIMSIFLVLVSIFFETHKVYAKNYDVNEAIIKLESYINNELDSRDEKKNIAFLSIKNMDFDSNNEYQTLHNSLQNKFDKKFIADVYRTSYNLIIVPEFKKDISKDNESFYTKDDVEFKNKIAKLGVENIAVIDKDSNFKVPAEYYDDIVASVAELYIKYFNLSDKYINHVNNKLFSNLEVKNINCNKKATGEFVCIDNKIVLSPDLFKGSCEEKNRENLKYTVCHEMGHAIEQVLCKKIFKDLELNNISKNGLERLAQVCFFGDNCQVAKKIQETVLLRYGKTANSKEAKDFIKENVSEYANTNASEFLAEVIAGGLTRNEEGIKSISNLVDEEIKKIIKGEGSLYQELKIDAQKYLQENDVI